MRLCLYFMVRRKTQNSLSINYHPLSRGASLYNLIDVTLFFKLPFVHLKLNFPKFPYSGDHFIIISFLKYEETLHLVFYVDRVKGNSDVSMFLFNMFR